MVSAEPSVWELLALAGTLLAVVALALCVVASVRRPTVGGKAVAVVWAVVAVGVWWPSRPGPPVDAGRTASRSWSRWMPRPATSAGGWRPAGGASARPPSRAIG